MSLAKTDVTRFSLDIPQRFFGCLVVHTVATALMSACQHRDVQPQQQQQCGTALQQRSKFGA